MLAMEEIFIVEPSSLRHEPTGFWQVAVSAQEGDARVPKIASDASIFFIFGSFRAIVRIPHIGPNTQWRASPQSDTYFARARLTASGDSHHPFMKLVEGAMYLFDRFH
ncbi:hypothetical protein WK53_16145 [Burkholderia ubonensis]|uniref:Uncharacterized protein n=1 Tax=Burkholderia ubonensis TaxID=101571 RepID=A0AAW3N0J0_9BURK|nr:hypothetical protein WK53_16145 [Burkholderia ubonensis]